MDHLGRVHTTINRSRKFCPITDGVIIDPATPALGDRGAWSCN
jgi:hypothetical protein